MTAIMRQGSVSNDIIISYDLRFIGGRKDL